MLTRSSLGNEAGSMAAANAGMESMGLLWRDVKNAARRAGGKSGNNAWRMGSLAVLTLMLVATGKIATVDLSI